MISNIAAFIKAVIAVKDIYKYIRGLIDSAEFNAAVERIRLSASKAKKGELKDRINAGSGVADNFNKHSGM